MARNSSEVNYEDALSAIALASNKQLLLAALTKTASGMGFDHVALDYVPARITGKRPEHVSSYSSAWVNECMQLPIAVIARDPVLQHLDSSVSPIIWGQPDYRSAKLDNVYELFQGYGLGSGLAVTVRGVHGDYACVGLSSASERVTKSASLTQELGQLMLTATAAYSSMLGIVSPKKNVREAIRLTPRELEILRWSRAGKTAQDCGQILGISQATVHFHLKNTLHKLDVASKHQAVLKALEMQLIH
jgi:DNA-binding CsgD family transcriptional regulator